MKQIVNIIDAVLADCIAHGILPILHDVVPKLVRMTVLQVAIRISLLLTIAVKSGQSELVTLASRQRLAVREEDIENFHDGFIRAHSIYLKHEVIQVSNILHPAASEEIRLFDVLERLYTKLLNAFQIFNQLGLVISNVIGQRTLLLLHPLVRWAERPAVHAEFLGWDHLCRLALATAGEFNPTAVLILLLGSDSLLIDLSKVFLLLFCRLGMLKRLIVAWRQVCNFLDRLGDTFDFKCGHVFLRGLKLVIRAIDYDHLSDLIRDS